MIDELHAIDQEVFYEPDDALADFTFEDLPEYLYKRVTELGWVTPTPVQAKAIPYINAGRDIAVQARTGSGKTGAYLLPIIDAISEHDKWCQALILVPTRELARQVTAVLKDLCEGSGLMYTTLYGGVGYGEQIRALKAGAQIIVGTPGRVLDHVFKGTFSVQRVTTLILDEADEMLSMGFYPAMRRLKRQLSDKRNTYLFSATIPYHVDRLAKEFMKGQDRLSLSQGNESVSTLTHHYYLVPQMQKERMLIRLIEMENPTSSIIFCNTKRNVEYLVQVLQNYGYTAQHITGDLKQNKRDRAMDKLREGNLRFLVATDVVARGIDISELSHVFMYDIPEHTEVYVHRSGRTARAGSTGIAITLCEKFEEAKLLAISKQYNFPLEKLDIPSEEQVSQRSEERLIVYLEEIVSELSLMDRERLTRFMPIVETLIESEDSKVLLAHLLDKAYFEHIHSPPVPEMDSEKAPAAPPRNKPRNSKDGDGRAKRRPGPKRRS
jgi:ATP-dependent RNA helicase DeaD